MPEMFPTTELKKHLGQLAKYNEQYVKECEIMPGVSPFNVKDVDGYYKHIEQWDTNQLRWKLKRCKMASSAKGVHDDILLAEFRDNMPVNFLGLITDNIPVYKVRCKDALKQLETAERIVLQGQMLPEPQRRHGYRITLDIGNVGFGEKDTERLKQGCRFILEDERADYVKTRDCPIVLDNALSIHYEINRRNIENGVYDMDIQSGVVVRDVERDCLDFPLTKDIPYIKNGKEIFRLRINVNLNPDSHGRVGRITVFKPVDMNTIGVSTPELYNRLPTDEKMMLLTNIEETYANPVLQFSRNLIHVQEKIFANRELIIQMLLSLAPYDHIGSETCVWASKTTGAGILAEESEKQADTEDSAKDPLQLAQMTEEFLRTLETMDKGIVDAHPRQSLFDATVSTFQAWVEYDLDPAILDPMLANMMYVHVAKIDPTLISHNFIKILDNQVKEGYEHWGWVRAWLEKFSTVAETLTMDDWRYVVRLTKLPIDMFLSHVAIDRLIHKLPKDKRVEFKKEFFRTDDFYEMIKIFLEDDDYITRWRDYVNTPFSKELIEDYDLVRLVRLRETIYLMTEEVKAKNKKWNEMSPYDNWINAFVEAREAGTIESIKEEGIPTIGLAKSVFVHDQYGRMNVGMEDHLGNRWSGFSVPDPTEFFGGDSIRENWAEMTSNEKIDWILDNTDITREDLARWTNDPNLRNIEDSFDDYAHDYYMANISCWNEENTEWDEECILDEVMQYMELNKWEEF